MKVLDDDRIQPHGFFSSFLFSSLLSFLCCISEDLSRRKSIRNLFSDLLILILFPFPFIFSDFAIFPAGGIICVDIGSYNHLPFHLFSVCKVSVLVLYMGTGTKGILIYLR